MMYTMPKNLLSICVNFALATQRYILPKMRYDGLLAVVAPA